MKKGEKSYTVIDAYKKYKPNISEKEYRKIIRGFMKFIASKILNGKTVTLPANNGSIEVIGKKIKPFVVNGKLVGVAPDWVGTKKLREKDPSARKNKTILYHFNEHTDGIRYKVKWYKPKTGSYNKNVYAFYTARSLKRGIWKNIMNKFEYRIGYEIELTKRKREEYKKIKENEIRK